MGVKVLLFATGCSVKAADFGDEIPEVVLKSLKIKVISCGHKGRFREIDCLQAVVEGGNEEGYYVAIRENADIECLQVPIICCEGTQFLLKKPSHIQEAFAEAEAAPGFAMHNGRPHGGRHERARGRAF
ncbi:rRNA-processing protein UTP23 [Tanacetum coccineum]